MTADRFVIAEPAAEVIDLWIVPTDQPDDVAVELGRLLDPGERARAAGPDSGLGRRFTVVHGVVRLLVAERLGLRPDRLAWQYGPHGKPEPAGARGHGLGVSYSASGALAVIALAAGRPVGVDVEEVRDPRVAARIARRYFPADEAAALAGAGSPAELAERFTELWCRREACVKAYGGRLVQGFGLPLAGPAPLVLADARALGDGPCRIADAVVPGPFRAAVAALGDRPFRLRVHHWTAPQTFNTAVASTR
ncbi:4'-phosphopantetheinyl transferase superfamily protein [Kitasatospora sp. NPDC047058]|uniref:4'-phosphopantetheinyl transferase family protein n=1 Tax=Kitasatospora sp. NPDC047058 TaxID=3155620 RepID=UPI0033E3F824